MALKGSSMHLVSVQDESLSPPLHGEVRGGAVERIPVEIWQKILSIAIACTLLPRDDDDYFQRRDVVEVGCAKKLEYIKSERIRTNLRLVCHSWDTFLEQYSDRLVYLSQAVPLGHWPPIRVWRRVVRVVGPGHLLCKCKQWCPISRHLIESARMTRRDVSPAGDSVEEQIQLSCLPMLRDQCRAIMWPSSYRDDLLDQERISHATMLCDDLMSQPSKISAISSSYRRLTYLNIILPSLLNPSLHLDLPQLVSLNLTIKRTIRADVDIPTISVDIGRWNLPSLRSIIFAGTVPARAIYFLLEQVGRNVTECYITPSSIGWRSQANFISNQIWAFLPSVRQIGVSFTEFVLLSPQADHDSLPINILVHFTDAERMFILPEDHVIARFQMSWTAATIGQLTIDVSWIDLLQSVIDCPEWSDGNVVEAELKAFEILNRLGNGLRDCEGALFDKNIKDQLWAAVERHQYIRRNFRRQRGWSFGNLSSSRASMLMDLDPTLGLDLRDFII